MEKRNKINKMKGEYTKKQAKVLRFYKFSVTLPEPNRRPCADGEAYVLCTRTGSSVERVESGSSISIMETRRLSEFTPYSGVDSSFMFSSLSGFARTLLSGNVNGKPTPLFHSPKARNRP